MPKQWYNIVPDLPKPLPPFLEPETHAPGAGIVPRIFPKEILGQEMSQERWIDIPEEVRDIYRTLEAHSPFQSHRAGESPENPCQNLLQIRRGQPSGKPQTKHRSSPSLLQYERRYRTHSHRNRSWPMGICLSFRMHVVRIESHRLHGESELPTETLPKNHDGGLRSRRLCEPEHSHRKRQKNPQRGPRKPWELGNRHKRSCRGRPGQRKRNKLRHRQRLQPRPVASNRDRVGDSRSR